MGFSWRSEITWSKSEYAVNTTTGANISSFLSLHSLGTLAITVGLIHLLASSISPPKTALAPLPKASVTISFTLVKCWSFTRTDMASPCL